MALDGPLVPKAINIPRQMRINWLSPVGTAKAMDKSTQPSKQYVIARLTLRSGQLRPK